MSKTMNLRANAKAGSALLLLVCCVAAMLGIEQAGAQHAHFQDVADSAYYAVPVKALAADGVFRGTECGDGRFCPDEPVTRWQMAVWVVRMLDGQEPPAITTPRFRDVGAHDWYAAHVERMSELGVTQGCGDERFCPDEPVTRAQMAVFLTRAYHLPNGPDPEFGDVPVDAWYKHAVAALAASGITQGCGDGINFCPDTITTRAQMATFLYRATNRGDGTTQQDRDGDTVQSDRGDDTTQQDRDGDTHQQWAGTGQTELAPATLEAGLYRVTFTVSNNVRKGGSRTGDGYASLKSECSEPCDEATVYGGSGSSGTWERALGLPQETEVAFAVGFVEPQANWTIRVTRDAMHGWVSQRRIDERTGIWQMFYLADMESPAPRPLLALVCEQGGFGPDVTLLIAQDLSGLAWPGDSSYIRVEYRVDEGPLEDYRWRLGVLEDPHLVTSVLDPGLFERHFMNDLRTKSWASYPQEGTRLRVWAGGADLIADIDISGIAAAEYNCRHNILLRRDE